eukprot:4335185-Lingulodinium_polyedra.AAC.1
MMCDLCAIGQEGVDGSGRYVEPSISVSKKDDDKFWHYLTEGDWVLREMQLGRCGGGSKQEQYETGRKLFGEKLMTK